MVVFERYNMRSRSWARDLLIGVNVLFFLGEVFAYNTFITWFAMWPSDILNGQFLWTLVTSTFLHGDFWHIFFNMWGLYIFGNDVEQYFGSWVFLGLYLFWGVFAKGPSYLSAGVHCSFFMKLDVCQNFFPEVAFMAVNDNCRNEVGLYFSKLS